MDQDRKMYELRILLVGLFFTLIFSIIIVRAIQLTFFTRIDDISGRTKIGLITKKKEITDEGKRLDYILGHIEKMTIKEIQLEVKKTRKYIEKIKDQTDRDIKSLKRLKFSIQTKEKEIEELQQKQKSIEQLQDSDIELLRTLIRDNSRNRTLWSFITGVITSLVGAYLFYYRKILISQLVEFKGFIISSIRESLATKKGDICNSEADLEGDDH